MVAGNEISTGLHEPVSGAAFVEGNDVRMTLTVAQKFTRPTSFVSAAFTLSNPNGAAQCDCEQPG